MKCKDGGIVLAFPWREVKKIWVMVAGVPAEIRTRHFTIISQERYC
jgi:hypothetical protein